MNGEYAIVRVLRSNYEKFDAMVFHRVHGREQTEEDRMQCDYAPVYETLKNPNLFVYAAQVEERFVGWISIAYLPKVGRTNGKGYMFVDELWVHPSCRGRGIARSLMEKADALAEDFSALGTRLYVGIGNDSAIGLYEACGYVKDDDCAFFMEKRRR